VPPRRIGALACAVAATASLIVACSSDSGGQEGIEGIAAASEALGRAGITCDLAPGGTAAELAAAQPDSVLEAGFCVVDRSTLHLVVLDGPASATLVAIDQQEQACAEPGDDVTLVRGYNWMASLRPPARGLGQTLATVLDGNVLVTACTGRGPVPTRRLPVGESAPLGTFDVRVTAVDPDAEERVLAIDPANEPATGAWVLVTFEATNVGDEPAVAYESLTPSVVGPDGSTTYEAGPCGRQLAPKEATAVGDTITLLACFDLPTTVVDAGAVRIVGGETALWRLAS
jgi:hypothetical protein